MAREVVPQVFEVLFPRAIVNAYLVLADVPTIIDTGTPGGAAKMLRAVEAAGLAPQDVKRILLTHRHADHAGNAGELARATGAEVHVAPIDAPFVIEGLEQPRPDPTTPLGRVLVPYVKVALPWRLDPVPAQSSLEDGASVGPFRVVATPGHTAGHVSLLWEDRGICFTGDAAANITRVGPHPANDDPARARVAFATLAAQSFEVACFGHGRTLKSGAAERLRR
ncbi:MAG: MBL fold metallo-hydrolase, partial [Solirubrobacteraceae bacterium]